MFPSRFPAKIFSESLNIHVHAILVNSAHYTLLKIFILVTADEEYQCFTFQ
jgi:aromatic ring-opening dioxygenase catalytic subunit (LigB family)